MYLNSTKVKVFPSAYRGKNSNNQLFNPESRLNTEKNLIGLSSRLTSRRGFVLTSDFYLSSEDTGSKKLGFCILGYWFELTLSYSDLESFEDKVYGFISIEPKNSIDPSADNNTDYAAESLSPLNGDVNTLDNSSGYFVGLELLDEDLNLEGILLLVKEDGNWYVPNSSQYKINLEDIGVGSYDTSENKDISFKLSDYLGIIDGNTSIGATFINAETFNATTATIEDATIQRATITDASIETASITDELDVNSGNYNLNVGNTGFYLIYNSNSGISFDNNNGFRVRNASTTLASLDVIGAVGTLKPASGATIGTSTLRWGQGYINTINGINYNGTTITLSNYGISPTYASISLPGIKLQSAESNPYIKVTNGYVEAQYFNATSDRRLKENIKSYIPHKSILDLDVVEFDYKDTGKHSIGCIAQELQEICPEIVHENENGYLTIEENKIVYLLLEEVKELKKKLEDK